MAPASAKPSVYTGGMETVVMAAAVGLVPATLLALGNLWRIYSTRCACGRFTYRAMSTGWTYAASPSPHIYSRHGRERCDWVEVNE